MKLNGKNLPNKCPVIKNPNNLFLIMLLSWIINIFLLSNAYSKTEYKIEDLTFDNSAFLTVDGV